MRILVTGASGFVGGHLVPALLDAGHDVVALVRDRDRYDAPPGVTVRQGDLLEHGSFEHALEGIEVGYYLVHSMHAGDGFEERDRRAARNFAREASEADVARIIYLGGLGRDSDRLSCHLRSRREVEHILEAGEYELTVLRAAIIIGDGSMSFELIRQLTEWFPILIASSWIRTRCQPIAISDVIAYLVGVLSVPATKGNAFEIGGPQVFTYKEILSKIACATQGRKPLVMTVPIHSLRLSARWIGLVTNISTSVTESLIHGLKNPVVVHDTRIQSLIPIEPTPFDEAVQQALDERNDRSERTK